MAIEALWAALERVIPGHAQLSRHRLGYALTLADAARWRLGELVWDRRERRLATDVREMRFDALVSDLVVLPLASPGRPVALAQFVIRARAHGLQDRAQVIELLARLSRRIRLQLGYELAALPGDKVVLRRAPRP